jgi:hypothetical protein
MVYSNSVTKFHLPIINIIPLLLLFCIKIWPKPPIYAHVLHAQSQLCARSISHSHRWKPFISFLDSPTCDKSIVFMKVALVPQTVVTLMWDKCSRCSLLERLWRARHAYAWSSMPLNALDESIQKNMHWISVSRTIEQVQHAHLLWESRPSTMRQSQHTAIHEGLDLRMKIWAGLALGTSS